MSQPYFNTVKIHFAPKNRRIVLLYSNDLSDHTWCSGHDVNNFNLL